MTADPRSVPTSATLVDAARQMDEGDVGAVLVEENGRPVGIVSLGDLAVELDTDSALADISAASPNN
jgi:CBS domain-containing protein